MDTTLQMPISQRINMRLVVLLVAVGGLFTYFGFSSISYVLSHGIQHHKDYDEVDLKSLGSFVFNPDTGTDAQVPPHFRAWMGNACN